MIFLVLYSLLKKITRKGLHDVSKEYTKYSHNNNWKEVDVKIKRGNAIIVNSHALNALNPLLLPYERQQNFSLTSPTSGTEVWEAITSTEYLCCKLTYFRCPFFAVIRRWVCFYLSWQRKKGKHKIFILVKQVCVSTRAMSFGQSHQNPCINSKMR